MKRILICLLIASAFVVSPLMGEVGSARDEFSEAAEDLKSAGKQALKGLSSAWDSAGKAVEKKTKSLSSRACIGKWVFTNGKVSSTIECGEDGTMTFTQTAGKSSTIYAGSFGSSATVITFRVTKKTTKTFFTKSTDEMDQTWKLYYKSDNDESLTVSCPDLPQDGNGYSFGNPTVFMKK